MSPKGLVTQLGMIAMSIAIIATFIRPVFADITAMQDDIAVYQKESTMVTQVNSDLTALVEKLESVTTDDDRRLNTYLPNKVDVIAVERDLSIISQLAGVLYVSSDYSGVDNSQLSDNESQKSNFSLSVEGTYGQLKSLFGLLAANHYPLEVTRLSIDRGEGGFLSANISLAVYSYQPLETDNSNIF